MKVYNITPRAGCWGERTVEVPWFLQNVQSGSVLDIGSAESCYIDDLLTGDYGITHVALNDVRHFSAYEQLDQVSCWVGDIRKYQPVQIGKFDNILCISTLEHIALQAYNQPREVSARDSAYYPQKEAFQHMMTFLAPGGRMILTVPFGKFSDAGWVLTYDAGMIDELKAPYKVVEETYFTMTSRERDTWVQCERSACPLKGMDAYNGNMRANSVACLILENKEAT